MNVSGAFSFPIAYSTAAARSHTRAKHSLSLVMPHRFFTHDVATSTTLPLRAYSETVLVGFVTLGPAC